MTLPASFTRLLQHFLPRATAPAADDYRAVNQIRELAGEYEKLPPGTLGDRLELLRQQVRGGAKAESTQVMLPAFSLTLEAIRRRLGVTLYDVQLLAGLALSQQTIAEMQTGEGKTLVAALPAILHSLSGHGVHVHTVNSYLAERDFAKVLPAFQLLGISAGLIRPHSTSDERRAAYACDVTYGPGYEFGFDYLRDQAGHRHTRSMRLGEIYTRALRNPVAERTTAVQRGLAFAVIDEADSLLIDEANTPLLLSEGTASTAADAPLFAQAAFVANEMQADRDYVLDSDARTVQLTAIGVQALERTIAIRNCRMKRPWRTYVEQALHASCLLRRDVDYVVKDSRIELVDQNTGRIFADRLWRDGLHQAVQAKEGVPVLAEQRPLLRIARQRFLRLYDGVCGMTGTAKGSEGELRDVYHLGVVTIPTHRPCRRRFLGTRYFRDEASKYRAAAEEILQVHATGQPILVGTRTIASSEAVADRLRDLAVPFQILNGKQDADEAAIIANAGQMGAVTIATNMAGRGTDIRLGDGAAALGGLFVLGIERHTSARVDRQLLGRAGRQGDPGSCRFLVSADDLLIQHFAPTLAKRLEQTADGTGEAHGDYSRIVAAAQDRAERTHAQHRQQFLVQDAWMGGVLSTLAGRSEQASQPT